MEVLLDTYSLEWHYWSFTSFWMWRIRCNKWYNTNQHIEYIGYRPNGCMITDFNTVDNHFSFICIVQTPKINLKILWRWWALFIFPFIEIISNSSFCRPQITKKKMRKLILRYCGITSYRLVLIHPIVLECS